MKRCQHKYEVKRRVLDVSRNMFLEKGYAKTTIAEIKKRAGITTGSLYHFFKNKEHILLHLTQEVFDGAARFSDAMVKDSATPWLRFSLEIGIQLYLVKKYQSVAEIYLAAHQSAEISRMIVRSAKMRNQRLFQPCRPSFSPDDYYALALAIKGIIHSFIQETIYNCETVSQAPIFRSIEMVLMLFQLPEPEIEKTVKETHALIQKCTFKIYGFEVP